MQKEQFIRINENGTKLQLGMTKNINNSMTNNWKEDQNLLAEAYAQAYEERVGRERAPRPILGAKYLWDHGGSEKEEVTIMDIRDDKIPEKQHDDGSYSPPSTRTMVKIFDGGWVGWYDGRHFQLLQND